MLAADHEKACLCKKFDMVDRGEAHSTLCMLIKIKRDIATKTVFISQPNCSENILKRFSMENCNPVSTPLEVTKTKFHKISEDEESFNSQIYQQAIGCLTYVSTATRPDIPAAVGMLSQYSSNPTKELWMALKRILQYIKGALKFRFEVFS